MMNLVSLMRRRRRSVLSYVPAATYFEWINSPSSLALNALGATRSVLAQVTDQHHVPMASGQPTVTYTSGTTANISISGSTLTAVANGTSVITAHAATGGWTDLTGTATVAQVVATITISPSTPTVANGTAQVFTAAGVDANGHPVTLGAGTWASSDPTDFPITTGGSCTPNVDAGSSVIRFTETASGVSGTTTITASAVTGLVASPSSFSGAAGGTQQEAFTISGADVTSDVIAYSDDPSIATITSAPEQPTVGAATSPTGNTLTVPVTSHVGGGTPETVALEVDEAGNGTWVRQTAVSWAGSVTATQNVVATGLTGNTDYTGKIRAVTITSAGDSYPSAAIPSGTTTGVGALPFTSGVVARLRFDTGVTMNGAGVASAVDMIGGIKFAQATTANQPTITANAYNSKPCLTLVDGQWLVTVDGSGNPVNVPALNPSNVGACIVIGRLKSTAGGTRDVLSSHDNAAHSGYAFQTIDGNGRFTWLYGDGSAITTSNYSPAAAADTLLHSHVLVSDSGNPSKESPYLDFGSKGSAGGIIVGNTTKPTYINTNANSVGVAGTGASYDLLEILWMNRAPTSTELTNLHGYAQTEWGAP